MRAMVARSFFALSALLSMPSCSLLGLDEFRTPACTSDTQCRAGTTCQQPPNACSPSACGCDPSTGSIVCTADCGGRRCLL